MLLVYEGEATPVTSGDTLRAIRDLEAIDAELRFVARAGVWLAK
jgi:hypothetical protein